MPAETFDGQLAAQHVVRRHKTKASYIENIANEST